MGLAEISYPQAWYNVHGSDDLRWSVYNEGGTEVLTESQDYFLPAGRYREARTLFLAFWGYFYQQILHFLQKSLLYSCCKGPIILLTLFVVCDM